jgi:hypothetical protein
MTGYQMGGLMIMVFGIALVAASLTSVRIIPRSNHLVAQLGNSMLNWITRLFGAIVCILGLVTYLQH